MTKANQGMKKSVFALPLICVLATTAGISVFTEHSKAQQSTMDLEAFREAALAKHNEYRAKHGVPLMELDERLNQSSQAWAEKLKQDATEAVKQGKPIPFNHSQRDTRPDEGGENLYQDASYGMDRPDAATQAAKAVDKWYNEIEVYDYSNPGEMKSDAPPEKARFGIGHFTQVVWKDSTKLGCGSANANIDGMDYNFTVCQYSPTGNWIGQANYRENVLPPRN